VSGGVSKEQIEAAKQVDILDYLERREPDNIKRIGNRHILRDHDSFVISKGKWCWNSQGYGCKTATALNYLIKVRGYSFVDAVRELAGDVPNDRPEPEKAKPPPEPKIFALPPHSKDNKRIIAYLQSRGISRPLILECIERGLLYESAVYHNCIFVGRDEHGKARFAAQRGLAGDFKCDVDGSDKRFGFVLPPDFGKPNHSINSRNVAVFEAPIDTLSHKVMCEQGFLPPFNGWRLSLGGTSLLALTRFLEQHPEIESCVICTDNDLAGEMAAAKIAETVRVRVGGAVPPIGDDWNTALLALQKAERMKNRARSGAERGL